MALTKISDMIPATTLAGTELIPIIQSGVNKTVTPDVVKVFMGAGSVNVWGYVTAYANLPLGITSADPEVGDLVGVNTTTGVWIIGTQRSLGFYRRIAGSGVVADDYGTSPYSGFPLQADQAVVNAGTDDTFYVTPLTLATTPTIIHSTSDEIEFAIIKSYMI